MYILFDIGGTKMRIAASFDKHTFEKPIVIPTPKKFSDGISVFIARAKKLAKKQPIEAIGGGIAGPIDDTKSMLLNSPNISGWIRKPFAKEITKKLGAPVFLHNDAAIVGLGESAAGAGRQYSIVAYITISTGVNGVRIVNDRIEPSVFGFEIGHQILNVNNTNDTLENLISGTAFKKRHGKDPWKVTDTKAWDEVEQWLAYGINNTIVYWSPEIIILGGSMMKSPGISVDHVRKLVEKIVTIFPHLPKIEPAALGDVGGLHGALAYIHQKVQEQE